jgi:probable rRNA maturation factor
LDVAVENQSGLKVETSPLEALALFVLREEEAAEDAEISVALVDKGAMTALNLKFRALESPTDVLAFDLGDDDELFGEVIISPHVAAEQAAEEGIPESEELEQLLIHGLLHLLGYAHETEEDAERMFERQERLRRDFVDGGSI